MWEVLKEFVHQVAGESKEASQSRHEKEEEARKERETNEISSNSGDDE